MDLNQLEDAITPATKAILPVHLTGDMVDMPRLMEIADMCPVHRTLEGELHVHSRAAKQDEASKAITLIARKNSSTIIVDARHASEASAIPRRCVVYQISPVVAIAQASMNPVDDLPAQPRYTIAGCKST